MYTFLILKDDDWTDCVMENDELEESPVSDLRDGTGLFIDADSLQF